MKKIALLACTLILAMSTIAQNRQSDSGMNDSQASSSDPSSPADAAILGPTPEQEPGGDLEAAPEGAADAKPAPCKKETLAYYKKNKVKCTVGDKTFFYFNLSSLTKLKFTEQDITVEPVNTTNHPGFTFSSSKWQAAADPLEFGISFRVEGGLKVIGARLDVPKADQDKVKGQKSRDAVDLTIRGDASSFSMHVWISSDPRSSQCSATAMT